MSFQQSINGGTKLTFSDPARGQTKTTTDSQTSAMLNLGLGVRVSPRTTLNFSTGIGLTSESPDFSFSLNMPLHF